MDREAGRIGILLRAKQRGDVEASATLLRYAAEYLKARKPMPDALADYLAEAFERAANTGEEADGVPVEHRRIDRLAGALGMKRSNNRPRHIPPTFELAMLILAAEREADREGAKLSETKLKKVVAKRFGVGESTALSWIKEARPALKEADAILNSIKQANGLQSLVAPRNVAADIPSAE